MHTFGTSTILLMSLADVRSRFRAIGPLRRRSTTSPSPDPFSLPAGMTFGSTSGVAINSKGTSSCCIAGPIR